jgi:putative ABC transport system ATP-binding protein
VTEKEAIIDAENVTKNFVVGKNIIHVLKGISLKIYPADFAVLFGPSGCGKSTLLNIFVGLEKPTSGIIKIRGKRIYRMSEEKRGTFRARKIGMVHQLPYWIKSLNVVENIAMPLIIESIKKNEAIGRARMTLEKLKLVHLAKQRPSQLSGGEQQKVGIARALVTDPWIIFADEPTGNLDSKSGDEVLSLLQELNREQKRTVLVVTHNEKYWNCGNRKIEMEDGKIIKDT